MRWSDHRAGKSGEASQRHSVSAAAKRDLALVRRVRRFDQGSEFISCDLAPWPTSSTSAGRESS